MTNNINHPHQTQEEQQIIMAHTIHSIEQQIVTLKQRREQLKRQQADSLYRKLESLLGNQFSPELILGIVHEQLTSVSSVSPQQIKKWQEVGATFFRTRNDKARAADQTRHTTQSSPDTTQDAAHED